jgi:hypothetical protein
MKSDLISFIMLVCILSPGCLDNKNPQEKTIPIGENTFVHEDKVYKIINNELLQIGDLNNLNIRKLELGLPKLKGFERVSISFVKREAEVGLSSVYRGNFLYYKLELDGINNLKESFLPGTFTLTFRDDYGFVIYSTEISTNDLVAEVDSSSKVQDYIYYGKIEVNIDAQQAITKFSVSSNVRHK